MYGVLLYSWLSKFQEPKFYGASNILPDGIYEMSPTKRVSSMLYRTVLISKYLDPVFKLHLDTLF